MDKNKLITESNRFKEILGYSISNGKSRLIEAPGDEEVENEDETNDDFDFGEEGSPEDDVADDYSNEEDFSAVDEIEDEDEDEEVEEIDVTDIVNSSEEAKENSEEAVQVSQETNNQIKSVVDKLSSLENQLNKMDSIMDKVNKIESDIKTPEEELELKSLSSYPFNMKLTDYWSDLANDPNNNYKVTTQEVDYTLTDDDITDYNETDIADSFNPNN